MQCLSAAWQAASSCLSAALGGAAVSGVAGGAVVSVGAAGGVVVSVDGMDESAGGISTVSMM